MPLGLFGSSSSSKAQILSSEKPEDKSKYKGEKRDSCDNGRGTVLRLEKHVVTIEKKLAEGGFAIVYLVSDQKNRQFALKRQFVNEDATQVDSCKRECLILSSLRGHKNIVQYIDHLIMKTKNGVYDCMLLTPYYKTSILHQMNSRLTENRYFSSVEILSIFCDMCEAVARLHHATTPLIHRDLKVENILVDDRNRAAPPIFVLCDFGSATIKVLSTETHPLAEVEQEIERYTTLSYRSPEMVDLYSRKPIGTPCDIWAMGVMLYKLCYFSLPFGESALAIQNASFSFPSQPNIPSSIKAIIKVLLTSDLSIRPNIYQTSSLAFEASSKPCPVANIHQVPTISLSRAISYMEGTTTLIDSSIKSIQTNTTKMESCSSPIIPISSLVHTSDESSSSLLQSLPLSSITSVNPRLRPKPSGSIPRLPIISSNTSSPQMTRCVMEVLPSSTLTPTVDEPKSASTVSIPLVPSAPPQEDEVMIASMNTVEEGEDTVASKVSKHVRNVSDGGTLSKSAFRPYSETTSTTVMNVVDRDKGGVWNAFIDAPIEDDTISGMKKGPDDDDDDNEVDWSDPFLSAPFDPLPLLNDREKNRLEREEEKAIETESDVDEQRALNRRSFSYEHIDGVGDDASTDSRGRTDGDTTEDTGKDGEGDDINDGESTEGERTDGGTIDDVSGSRPLLDDDELEDNNDDDDEGEVIVEVDERRNEHEEDDDCERVTRSSCIPPSLTPLPDKVVTHQIIPPPHSSTNHLSDPSISTVIIQSEQPSTTTYTSPAAIRSIPPPFNPFNPFTLSTMDEQRANPPSVYFIQQHKVLPPPVPCMPSMDPPTSIISLNEPFHMAIRSNDNKSSYLSSRAPATLPRQVTSLSATPRPFSTTVTSTIPSHEVHSTVIPPPISTVSIENRRQSSSPDRVTFILSSENRKCHSSMQYEKMGSSSDEVDTDDSVAGMCNQGGKKDKKEGKKKRRDTHPVHHPFNAHSNIKPQKKSSTSSKTSSGQKALNASFVNVSFQSEDVDRF